MMTVSVLMSSEANPAQPVSPMWAAASWRVKDAS